MEIHEKEASIYRDVNTATPPAHTYLVRGWVPPEPPTGFKHLVAILSPVTLQGGIKSSVWTLDYLNTETNVFASESTTVDVKWPWVDGFRPNAIDWDAIGIPHLV
jgi:hypothetical protein